MIFLVMFPKIEFSLTTYTPVDKLGNAILLNPLELISVLTNSSPNRENTFTFPLACKPAIVISLLADL